MLLTVVVDVSHYSRVTDTLLSVATTSYTDGLIGAVVSNDAIFNL